MTPQQPVAAAVGPAPMTRSTLYRLLCAPKTFVFYLRYLRAVRDATPLRTALRFTRISTFRRPARLEAS